MSITTKHKGYEITFDEEADGWTCEAVGITQPMKLSTLKRKIENLAKDERSVNLKVYRINDDRWRESDKAKLEEVTIVLLCEATSNRWEKTEPTIKECWIKNSKGGRDKVYLTSLYPIEQRFAVEAYLEAERRARDMAAEAQRMKEALPTVTPELALASKTEAA